MMTLSYMKKDRIPLKRIDESEFDALTFESAKLSLVFFGARRCELCKVLMPIMEEVYFENQEIIRIYWVDVDKSKRLFQRFRLQGIPNILVFQDGEVVEKIRGMHTKEELLQVLDKVLVSGE